MMGRGDTHDGRGDTHDGREDTHDGSIYSCLCVCDREREQMNKQALFEKGFIIKGES